MKRLFFFIMAMMISLPSYSAEYRLPFVESQNGIVKIPFVEKEWILGADRDNWSLYIEKGMYEKHQAIIEFHAVTAYKKPYYSDGLKTIISKIYTYGALDCKNGNLHISGKRIYKINGQEKTKTISKQFKIGEGYDPNSLEATIEDGLLTVFVPGFKKQDKKKKKGEESVYSPKAKILNPTERQVLNADLQKQRMDAIIASFPDAGAQLKRLHFIIDKAKKDLGYAPHSFEEGISILDAQIAQMNKGK